MIGPLVRAGLRFHARRPAQLVLSLVGVALGVAVVTAMSLAIDSSRRAFDLSNEAVFGRVSHSLEAGNAGFDEAVYLGLRRGFPEIAMAPVVQAMVHLPGRQRSMTVLGVDPFAEAGVREGMNVASNDALPRLVTEAGTALVSADTARRLGVTVGARVPVVIQGRAQDLTVVGVVDGDDELARAGLEDVLLTDIATAQEVLGMVGRLSRIDVSLNAPGDELPAGFVRKLPETVRVETAAGRATVRREMTRAFYLNLRMLSLLALLVGMFIIYNALTFSVVQRRSLIGTLRAVGVTGREILLAVLAESAVLGAVATTVGLLLGVALAGSLLDLVSRTVDDLYFATTVSRLAVTPEGLLAPVLLGTVGTVVAALLPGLEATRIPPRAVMTDSHLERGARAAAPRLAGVAVCGALLSLVLLAAGGGDLGLAFAALFLVVVSATALTPAAILVVSRVLEPLARLPAGSIGAMAVRGLRRGLSRTTVAVAALMVALSATVGVATMVASFRLSLEDWLYTTLAADVYVRAPGRGVAARLPQGFMERVAALPGVSGVSVSRDVEVVTGVGRVWLKAINVEGAAYRRLAVLDGDADPAMKALARGEGVLLSEPLAWRHGLRRGSKLKVFTDRGPRDLMVMGVFRDYGSDRGMVLAGLPLYRALFADPGVNGMGLSLVPGADPGAIGQQVSRLAEEGAPIEVRTQAWIREASLTIFDRTFAITEVLRWLSTLVACVGVLSALMALALERAREVAVLRAQGMTRGQVMVMLQIQTGCMGLVAGLLSLPLGTVLALILVHVINRRAFGWGMSFHMPPEVLLQSLAVAVGAALLAGLYPGWRMLRRTPAAALREA